MKILKYLIIVLIVCLVGFCMWYFSGYNMLKRSIVKKYKDVTPYQWEENVDGVKQYLNTRYNVVGLTFNFSGGKVPGQIIRVLKYLIKEKIPATY